MEEFECRIVERGTDEEGAFVVLNGDPFYPDGKGGQLGDRGEVNGEKVLSVKEKGASVRVYLSHLPKTDIVKCLLDVKRRHTISALHTAQHILSAVLEDKFSVVTVSFHMSEENCTIDVEPVSVSYETLEHAENFANEVVFANLPVKKYFVTAEEAENLPLRKRAKVTGSIRIVEIPGVDTSMCGGTHVDYTGEIGLIKILKTEKIKKQFLRIYFAAERRALDAFRKKSHTLNAVSKLLSSGEKEIPDKVEKMLTEIKKLKKENKKLKITFLKNLVSPLSESKGTFIEKEVDLEKCDFMSLLVMLSSEDSEKVFLVYSLKNLLLGVAKGKESSVSLKEKLQDFIDRFEGKGVLRNNFAFAEFKDVKLLKEALEYIKDNLGE